MYDTKFLLANACIDKYYSTIRKCMLELAEIGIKGDITRNTEAGSITFKLY